MSVSLNGSAGDLRITFCAHIDHQDGQRIVELDALEKAANERLMELLLSDPTLVDLLDSFKTTGVPAKPPHDEAGHLPSDAETSVLQHTPEPAPQQRAGAYTAQQDVPTSDRGQDTTNHTAACPGDHAPATGEASTEDSPDPNGSHETNDQGTEGCTVEPSDSQSPTNPSADKQRAPRNQSKSTDPESLLYVPETEEGFRKPPKAKRPKNTKGSKKPKMRFTPTPRAQLTQYSCPYMERRYVQAAQPEGRNRLMPGPCEQCSDCINARRHEKMEQYAASKPASVSTVLECDFPNFVTADDFAKLEKHKTWIREARRCTLFVAIHEYHLRQPWKIRLILDSPASAEVREAIEQHAISAGARNVSVTVRPVSPGQFKAWVPRQFSIKKGPKSYYNLCRFSNGWAQKEKPPSDYRSGKKEMIRAQDSPEIPVPTQSDRAKAITESWKPTYLQSINKHLPPEERRELTILARRQMQRARHVSFIDWIRRWETLQPEYTDLSRKFIEDYLNGKKPSAREWQEETKGPKELVVETARWLNEERDVEACLVTVAQRFGFIPEGPHPAIDNKYLAELTSTLPPLVFYDEPYPMATVPNELDLFDDCEEAAD